VLWKSISIAVLLSVFVSSCGAFEEENQQTIGKMREIALTAVEKNRQVTVLLKTKREGKKKFSGRPENVSERGFTLANLNTGQETEFAFAEVRELRMKRPRVGLYVGLGALAGGAVIATYILSQLSSD